MSAENIALMRRWFEEVWNLRRGETIDELLAPESVCHADDGPIRGPDDFKKRFHVPFLIAFPDLRLEVESIVAQGDEVVIRWSSSGTHRGEGLGFAPTHQPVLIRGMTWVHVRDGKIQGGWQHSNIMDAIRGLAAIAARTA